jgi:hypothetical protein
MVLVEEFIDKKDGIMTSYKIIVKYLPLSNTLPMIYVKSCQDKEQLSQHDVKIKYLDKGFCVTDHTGEYVEFYYSGDYAVKTVVNETT